MSDVMICPHCQERLVKHPFMAMFSGSNVLVSGAGIEREFPCPNCGKMLDTSAVWQGKYDEPVDPNKWIRDIGLAPWSVLAVMCILSVGVVIATLAGAWLGWNEFGTPLAGAIIGGIFALVYAAIVSSITFGIAFLVMLTLVRVFRIPKHVAGVLTLCGLAYAAIRFGPVLLSG